MIRPLPLLLGTFVLGLTAGSLLPGPASAQSAAPQTSAAPQGPDADFAISDRDGDADVDLQEYRLRMVEVFYFADSNKDGKLTPDEVQATPPADSSAFRAADKNGDGVLTLQEFVDYRIINFREADTNGDGKLTKDEVSRWNASPH